MHARADNSTIELLIVEDDPGDVLLTRESLAQSAAPHNLTVVADGESAVAYLRREGNYAKAPRPDLVILDLNLPRLDGWGVLAQVKNDPGLRTIPVVVLTTSEAREDVVRSYDLHANAYVTKPADLDTFTEAVRRLAQFFLGIVKLPSAH